MKATPKQLIISIVAGSLIGVVIALTYRPKLEELTNEQKVALINGAKRNSVMVISSYENSGSKGSGVVIKRLGEKAIVITNAHVVGNGEILAKNVAVKSMASGRFLPADIIYWNLSPEIKMDIALLVVNDPKNELGQEVRFAGEVKEGQFVVSVGSPLNEEFTTDDGYVRYVRNDADGTIIAHDALVEHGSSGGGLFNSNGDLVGINTYILDDKKTGVALYGKPFLSKLRLYSLKIDAKSDWQNSGVNITPQNNLMLVLANGKCGLTPEFRIPSVARLEWLREVGNVQDTEAELHGRIQAGSGQAG